MKNCAFSLSKKTTILLVGLFFYNIPTAWLQGTIEGSANDAKHANTTIIYKAKTATDTDVLNDIDQTRGDVGMGEVIRITVAPPAPKVEKIEPVEVKNTVLAPEKASVKPATQAVTQKKSVPIVKTAAKKPVAKKTAPKVVKPAAKEREVIMVADEKEEQSQSLVAEAKPIRSTATRTATTAKKQVKKGKKVKKRKPHNYYKHKKYKTKGKQKYGCPTF